MGIESAYNEIIKKLDLFSRKEFKVLAMLGIQIAFLLALSTFIVFLAIAIASLFILFILPFLRFLKIIGKLDYNSVAKKVGEKFPEVKDELLNALQLTSLQDKNLYSSNLITASFIRTYEKVKTINFNSAIT